MAKINIEFDTVAKTATFTKDGKVIPDVESCAVYKDYDGKFFISVHSSSYDEDNDMRTGTYLSASEQEKVIEFLRNR